MSDYEKMTDEELDAIIQGKGSEDAPIKKRASVERNARRVPLSTDAARMALQGMSGPKLFLTGMGGDVASMLQGISDKARIAFRPVGEAGEEALRELNRERENRRTSNAVLYDNPEALGGRFASQFLQSVAAPARLGAQTALAAGQEFTRAPIGPTSGLASELINSGVNAAEAGGLTALMSAPLSLLGKGAGAATGRFTPEGSSAMALNDAARGHGVKMRIADLDPWSSFGQIERRLPGQTRAVAKQATQLKDAVSAVRDIPSKTGRSTEARLMEGEKLRTALTDASDDLMQAGAKRWDALDDFVTANKLRPVVPDDLFRKLEDVAQTYTPKNAKGAWEPAKNPIFQRVDDIDPKVGSLLRQVAGSTYQDVAKGVPFSSLNEMRVAIGKAYGKARRDFARAAEPSADLRAARDELGSLYGKLNNDIERWGTINAKHAEGKALFNDAVGFWRDRIVPDVINNPLAGKASKGWIGRDPRGFTEPRQLYTALESHPDQINRLRDGMTPEGRSLIDTFLAAEDARRAMATGKLPAAGWSEAAGLLPLALGHPLSALGAITSHLPGTTGLATSRPVKTLHFARDLTRGVPPSALPSLDLIPRAAWGAAQYPIQELEDYERGLTNRPQR